jgi:hypothetical protein
LIATAGHGWELKVGYLDWIKTRGKNWAAPSDSKDAGKSMSQLFAEWRLDYKLAKQRDETGREPASRSVEKVQEPKSEAKKAPAKRDRIKGHDISF